MAERLKTARNAYNLTKGGTEYCRVTLREPDNFFRKVKELINAFPANDDEVLMWVNHGKIVISSRNNALGFVGQVYSRAHERNWVSPAYRMGATTLAAAINSLPSGDEEVFFTFCNGFITLHKGEYEFASRAAKADSKDKIIHKEFICSCKLNREQVQEIVQKAISFQNESKIEFIGSEIAIFDKRLIFTGLNDYQLGTVLINVPDLKVDDPFTLHSAPYPWKNVVPSVDDTVVYSFNKDEIMIEATAEGSSCGYQYLFQVIGIPTKDSGNLKRTVRDSNNEKVSISLTRKELIRVLKRFDYFGNWEVIKGEGKLPVEISFHDGKMWFYSESKMAGKVRASVPIEGTKELEGKQIAVTYEHLLHAVSACDDDEVAFMFSGENFSKSIIKVVTGKNSYTLFGPRVVERFNTTFEDMLL